MSLPSALRQFGGGFDCILGNPPWERVKLQEKEWFAERVPDIANAPNAAARTKLIKALAKERPELHEQFLADARSAEAASAFMRGSGRYPLCGRGDVNLYTVFAESMRDGVSPVGRVGCIVPSGIATDDTTKFFFQDLVDRASLASLFDFENALPLFEGVHRSYKFSCLTLRSPAPDADAAAKAPPAEFVFFAHKVEDLVDERRRFTLTRDEIALVNPNTKTCPIFRTRVDAELTKFIYRRVPVLAPEERLSGDLWRFELITKLFDMADDSDLFQDPPQSLNASTPVRHDQVRLLEAKMIHLFDSRWGSSKASDDQEFDAARKAEPNTYPTARYWVDRAELDRRLDGRWSREWLFGWRDICRSTDERTAIFALCGRAAVGHTLRLLLPLQTAGEAAWLCGGLSSFSYDFVVRQKAGGTHLTFGTLTQTPIWGPLGFRALGEIIGTLIARRVLELSATADDMAPFSKDLWPEGDGAVFRYDPERRFEIRCELDAAFFHLYLGTADEWSRTASPELRKSLPTPRDAVAYIMDTFPIVKRKDEDAHGHYRTKDRILALYDELQRCLAADQPFKSTLNPPPGPPTNPDGSVAKLPAWPKGAPKPTNWPAHIHPPFSNRSST